MMIKGKTVVIKTPEYEIDRYNNRVVSGYTETTVSNVLISPGATLELEASRPEGVSVAYTLHFPKTFSGNLEGCLIALPSPYTGTYRVIGKPTPYQAENTPTLWHMPVEVENAHG